MGEGLPVEGKESGQLRALDRTRRDVLTCGPSTQIEQARRRAMEAGQDYAVVVNEPGLLLGFLKLGDELYPPREVESVMDPAPLTIRPGTPLTEAAQRMEKGDLESVLVTNADGYFIGVLYRDEASDFGEQARTAEQT
jgi:CBS domain-containing protein